MKVQEVILRAMAKRITWWQAAEILEISDRHMRRWRQRYEQYGYDPPRRIRPAAREAEPEARPPGAGGRSAAVISGEGRGPECAAHSREVAGHTRSS